MSTRTKRRPHARHRTRALAWAAAICGALVLVAGGYLVWSTVTGELPTSVPSCTWPLRARGPETSEQAGLIRCYLRTLATHDSSGMLATADTTDAPPVRITSAAFAYAASAQSGSATATFTPNPDDTAYVLVTIAFAAGTRQSLSMVQVNPSSAHSWRLQIGTHTGPPGPPPVIP
jgi:hypothetical protein